MSNRTPLVKQSVPVRLRWTLIRLACSLDVVLSTVHGNWALWSSWGDCTVTCGAGQRRRFRTCTNPRPRFSGRECVGLAQDTQLCNTQNCAGQWVTTALPTSDVTGKPRLTTCQL